MRITYQLKTDVLKDEDGIKHTVYGIKAVKHHLMKSTASISIPDIFFDRKKAVDFVHMCNRDKLNRSDLIERIETLFE